MPQTPDIPIVSRFEADLLSILRGFLGHLPRTQLLSLLSRQRDRPPCLSRSCVSLVEDTLAKGATLLIARQAWQHERFLRGDTAVPGRLWQRTAPAELGMIFSRSALSFLLWATASDAGKRGEAWTPPVALELGDRWLLATAYDAVRDSLIGAIWKERHPWRNEALCRLFHAIDFDTPAANKPDFTPWLTPAGIGILEASQQQLAERWLAMEQMKSRLTTVQQLRAAALGQSRVLEAYLAAIDHAGRRDLARFLLIAGARLFQQPMNQSRFTTDDANAKLRLAERQQAQRDTLVVAQQFETLARWQAEARNVGYFDEGYQAAQLWKLDWEAYKGETTLAAAQQQRAQTAWL